MTWAILIVSQLVLAVICRGYFGMGFWPTQAVLTTASFAIASVIYWGGFFGGAQ